MTVPQSEYQILLAFLRILLDYVEISNYTRQCTHNDPSTYKTSERERFGRVLKSLKELGEAINPDLRTMIGDLQNKIEGVEHDWTMPKNEK